MAAIAVGTSTGTPALLRVSDLSKRFGGLVAVSQVSFEVAPQTVVAVVGPNGAGKTTLFNLIAGVLSPDAGSVYFQGSNVTGISPTRLAAGGIGRTFQNIRLFSHLNAIENVMIGMTSRATATVVDALFATPRGKRQKLAFRERAETLLDWVGIGDHRYRMPSELPYGDQRRVEIARALALEPKLLILDEPTAGMVAREAHEVIGLIDRLRGSGITLMLIEHNMNVVMSTADKVIVLNFGEKIAEGTPAEIRQDDRVIEAYLGSDE